MARAFFRSLRRPNFYTEVRMAYLVLVGTIPAAGIGFLFEGFFETEVRSPWVVVFNLVFVGLLFLMAEAVGHKNREAAKMRISEAIGFGIAQACALVPGVSRSGATITFGLFVGESARRPPASRS